MVSWSRAGRLLVRAARAGLQATEEKPKRATRGGPPRPSAPATPRPAPSQPAYRGDFEGRATIEYAPRADGDADPGEVVWAWVPFEDDPTQGKDRPVLVLAMVDNDLLGLMLTSKDHDSDRDDGRRWFDLGSGAWDNQGRPSEVRLDRVLRLAPSAVRREGAALDRARFDQVAAAARDVLGW